MTRVVMPDMDGDGHMLTPRIGFALICAAAALPAGANRIDSNVYADSLAVAIAIQGDQALRDIRREARLCLRTLKPAPLPRYAQTTRYSGRSEIKQVSL